MTRLFCFCTSFFTLRNSIVLSSSAVDHLLAKELSVRRQCTLVVELINNLSILQACFVLDSFDLTEYGDCNAVCSLRIAMGR